MAYTASITKVDFVAKFAIIEIRNDSGKLIQTDKVFNDSLSVPVAWQAVADRRLIDGLKARRDKFEAVRLEKLAEIAELEAAEDSEGSVIISEPIPRPGGG